MGVGAAVDFGNSTLACPKDRSKGRTTWSAAVGALVAVRSPLKIKGIGCVPGKG